MVFGVAYDLIYSFAYVRLYDVKDPRYGPLYGWGLLALALGLPATIGIVASIGAWIQAFPFKSSDLGIAIAPFEVFSVAPETLGTSTMLQALDIVGTEFFRVVENTMNNHEWAKEFKFRFLPQYLRVKNKDAAVKHCAALQATVLVWGVITQRSRQALEVRLTLQGAVKQYEFTNFSIEEFPLAPLQLFILLEGAETLRSRGAHSRAIDMLVQGRPVAVEAEGNDPKRGLVALVDEKLAELRSLK